MSEPTGWLLEFMDNTSRLEDSSCSCSKDCDREREAAYKEILRLRGEVMRLNPKDVKP